MDRTDVLDAVAQHLIGRRLDHPLRVGIDGVCGSGKTTFRHRLAGRLRDAGVPVLEIDSDGFHHVRAVRHRQGRDSARGYYEDAYDFAALERHVLVPLGRRGPGPIAVRVHDLATDEVVFETAPVDPAAIVLFDCTFLQRGALRDLWDDVVHLEADEGVARARGIARDAAALGGLEAAARAWDRRYLEACRMYVAEERPRERATLIVDNTDPARPSLLRS